MIFREFRNDGKSYDIAIFANEAGKYQYVNLTKEKICPCEFDSYEAAFADLLKYINQGKINGLSFKENVYADISTEKRMV